VQLRIGHPDRCERTQSLDVVDVQMAEQQVDRPTGGRLGRELDPERARAGARIEHHEGVVVQPDLDARGVPPVASGLRSRRGDRAS
jgi:hypothetical protein